MIRRNYFLILVILLITNTGHSQKKSIEFGIHISQAIGMLNNNNTLNNKFYKYLEDQALYYRPIRRGLPFLSKFQFNVSLTKLDLQIGLGSRLYHQKLISYSTFNDDANSYPSIPHTLGTATYSRKDGFLFLFVSKRFNLTSSWSVAPYVTSGGYNFVYSQQSHSVADDPEMQSYHDLDDTDYISWGHSKNVHDFEFGTNFSYQLGWFSFQIGSSYYLYKDWRYTHHSLMLNVGLSLMFGENYLKKE